MPGRLRWKTESDRTARQGTVPLRRNRDFMLLMWGQAVSSVGSRMSLVAFPLLALALTKSPAKAGLTGFIGTLPYVLGYLPAGVLVDRWDRKRLMIACDVLRAAGFASIPVAYELGHLALGQVWTVAFLEGTGFVFFSVAEFAVLPHLVDRSQIPVATARNEVRLRGAALVGQPLGGLLFSASHMLPFLADAVSYLVSAISLARIRASLAGSSPKEPEPVLRAIREGIAWLWGQHFLRACTVLISISNLVMQALILTSVVLVKSRGGGDSIAGLGLGLGSGAALAGSVTASATRIREALSPKSVICVFFVLVAVTFSLYAIPATPLLTGLLFAVPAFFVPILNVVLTSYEMLVIPDELVGRVRSSILLVSWGALPFGSLLGGFLLQRLGQTVAPLAFGSAMAIVALAALATRSLSGAAFIPGGEHVKCDAELDLPG